MSKFKAKPVPVPAPKVVETPPQPVAWYQISKMSDGSLRHSQGGCDSDVLGLLDVGQTIIRDRVRTNAALAAQVQAHSQIKGIR